MNGKGQREREKEKEMVWGGGEVSWWVRWNGEEGGRKG